MLVGSFLSSGFFLVMQTHSGMWLTCVFELLAMRAHGPEMVAAECFNKESKFLVSQNITSLGVKSFHRNQTIVVLFWEVNSV